VATDEHRRELGALMRRLPAHSEVGEAIERLRSAGFGVVALTNSVLATAEDQLANAGLRPLFDAVYSADQVRRLKPAPQPYRHVVDTHRLAPADAVLIAAHDWDVAGATAAGLATAFVARQNRIPLAASDAPTVTGLDLTEVTATHRAVRVSLNSTKVDLPKARPRAVIGQRIPRGARRTTRQPAVRC
jgi:2-haloacid dehalogenase